MSEEIKQIIEVVKANNPYPESVFTEPTSDEWLKVQQIFKEAGLIQDKFFGSQSRIVWNHCCDLIIKTIDEIMENILKKLSEEIGETQQKIDSGELKFIHSSGKLDDSIDVESVLFNCAGFEPVGGFVAVRPVDDNKTYLGIYLGECPTFYMGMYVANEKKLVINCRTNPMMFLPELEKVVFGYESWWKPLKSEDDLKQITDADIENVWYVKALKSCAKNEGSD